MISEAWLPKMVTAGRALRVAIGARIACMVRLLCWHGRFGCARRHGWVRKELHVHVADRRQAPAVAPRATTGALPDRRHAVQCAIELLICAAVAASTSFSLQWVLNRLSFHNRPTSLLR